MYNKIFDFGRAELLCLLFPQVLYETKKYDIKLAFGGSSVVFLREIPMLRKYNIYTRVISWSRKWLYMQGVFTLPAKGKKTNAVQKKSLKLSTRTDNLNTADPGMSSGMSTPSTVTVPAVTASGETICAVMYGRYVFKRGRVTVPVNEVLGICGYSGDEDIEKKRVEGWEYVQGLDHDWDKDTALLSTVGI